MFINKKEWRELKGRVNILESEVLSERKLSKTYQLALQKIWRKYPELKPEIKFDELDKIKTWRRS